MTTPIKFSDKEMEVLQQLCKKHDMSMTDVVRQAIRIYQFIEVKRDFGMDLAFYDVKTGEFFKMVSMGGPLAKPDSSSLTRKSDIESKP